MMCDKQDLPVEVSSAEDARSFVPSRKFPQSESSETAGTELRSSKVWDDINCRIGNLPFERTFVTYAIRIPNSYIAMGNGNSFFNTKAGVTLEGSVDFGKGIDFSQRVFPQVPSSGFLPLKFGENKATKIENSYLQNQFSSMSSPRIVPSSESAIYADTISNNNQFGFSMHVNNLSLCEQNSYRYFRNGHLSSDHIEKMRKPMELQFNGRHEHLQKHRILSGVKEYHTDNDFSLNVKMKESYIPNKMQLDNANQHLVVSDGKNTLARNPNFIDQNYNRILSNGQEDRNILSGRKSEDNCIPNATLLNIANQLLLLSDGHNSEVKNTDFPHPLSLNRFSVNYFKLYTDTDPKNFDFAMNIMAYVEILNDFSWTATFTFFDENVKNMVKYVWNNLKNVVNRDKVLQKYYSSKDFLDLMVGFTKNSPGKNYKIEELLKYCIIMCQLGVFARKRNFKEAPLYVIDFLRKGIEEMENSLSIMFEMYIKKYAEEPKKYAEKIAKTYRT